jgi:glutaredoxin 3
MVSVEVYSSEWCGYCAAARRLLDGKGVEYRVIGVDGAPERRAEMQARGGRHTVPQIFIDGQPLGGFDELSALDRTGRLDRMLGIEVPESR